MNGERAESFATWFSNKYATMFDDQVTRYITMARERILPAFGALEQEAEQVTDSEYEGFGQHYDPECHDPAALAETAFENGVTHYVVMSEVAQGVRNLLAAGLYHLFEQQVATLMRTWSAGPHCRGTLCRFEAILSDAGFMLAATPSWLQVSTELKHLANVVKHAEGPSAQKLRKRRPDLFRPKKEDGTISFEDIATTQPLAGESIYVTERDLEDFAKAICALWRGIVEDGKINDRLPPAIARNE